MITRLDSSEGSRIGDCSDPAKASLSPGGGSALTPTWLEFCRETAGALLQNSKATVCVLKEGLRARTHTNRGLHEL